jgi:hypothetical protein
MQRPENLEKINGLLGYLYATEILPTTNNPTHTYAERTVRVLAKLTCLQINNEYYRR